MDECRLLVMLHRALPTRGHGSKSKACQFILVCLSTLARFLWRISALVLHERYWATIGISAIAQKLSGRVRERCASACSSPVAAFML